MIGTKMSHKGRPGLAEKRGARYLENPPKPRTYKAPISAFVHYESMGGDLVAFEVRLCMSAISKLDSQACNHPNVVTHYVELKLKPNHRLVVLPSRQKGTV